jgi:energy-coupling factor transporter ATP-binding protein EcfA2
MIQRIYADNYKCLENFDFTPGRLQLFVGRNGSGKSAVFEVLNGLRALIVSGKSCAEVFPAETRSRWVDDQRLQAFELEIAGEGGRYRYRLEIAQESQKIVVREESLQLDGVPLITFRRGKIQFYGADGKAQGTAFQVPKNRSGLWMADAGRDRARISWFKERVSRILCFQPNPWAMSAEAGEADADPAVDLSNFATWYRQLADERPAEAVTRLFESLGEVLDDFEVLRFKKVGERVRALSARFRSAGEARGEPLDFSFSELSHGQKCLIVLYTLLHCALGSGHTLGLDEPAHFVALAEIEPWLELLQRRHDETEFQLFIISHHPEVLNRLAGEYGILFYREGQGPTRIRPFPMPEDSILLPGELVARGWEQDEPAGQLPAVPAAGV